MKRRRIAFMTITIVAMTTLPVSVRAADTRPDTVYGIDVVLDTGTHVSVFGHLVGSAVQYGLAVGGGTIDDETFRISCGFFSANGHAASLSGSFSSSPDLGMNLLINGPTVTLQHAGAPCTIPPTDSIYLGSAVSGSFTFTKINP